jgi:glycosyltransferase involved in cell wall biosynthesis
MARYLPETIESVLANLGPNDRYFVVDGGSTDDSLRVLASYADRISGWVSEPDRGYADAVAKGFAMARTEYQCWIACGDLLLPGALDLARSVLVQTGAEMIFGDDFYIDEQGRILRISNGGASNLAAMMLHGAWTPLQDACFWRSDLYRQVGGIDAGIRYAADYDLFLRMALQGCCAYTPHVFSAFRRHDGQTSQKHRLAYRTEKLAARAAVACMAAASRASVLARPYYWLYPRLRARLASAKALPPHVLGGRVLEYRATASRDVGVAA